MIILRQIHIWIVILFDTLIDRLIRIDPSHQNLLIIRLDAIGDFFLWADSAKEYRRLFPNHRITLLANKTWAPLAKDLPFFDKIIEIDRFQFIYNFSYRFKHMRFIRKSGFDIAISPLFTRELLLGDSVIRLCGAKDRIGFDGEETKDKPDVKKISDRWYTRLLHSSNNRLMEAERNGEFIRQLGVFQYKNKIVRNLWKRPASLQRSLSQPYYVIVPGAGRMFRRWPVENFIRLSEIIHSYSGLTGIICGGKDERAINRKIIDKSHAPLIDLTGETSLEELIGIIERAFFIIGNDSSAAHIAPVVNTPCVCILGGGHFGRFFPYPIHFGVDNMLPIAVYHQMNCFGCNWDVPCLKSPKSNECVPCIRIISVNDVWEKVEHILSNNIPSVKTSG